MTTIIQAMRQGSARLEFLFYVGGMPWASATSSQLVSLLAADTSSRRDIFGNVGLVGNTHYPADSVEIFNTLQRPGEQTIRCEPGQWIEGGDWTIHLARDFEAQSAYHFRDTTSALPGLEGLDLLPQSDIDEDVFEVYLARNVLSTDTTVYVSGDQSDRFYDWATDATAHYRLIWIGGECMGFSSADVSKIAASGGDPDMLSIDVTRGDITTNGGLLHTQKQTFMMDRSGSAAIVVSNAPHGGIGRYPRPAYLWAFLISDTNTIEEKALVRHGYIDGAVDYKKGISQLSCRPWHAWLEAKTKKPIFDLRLSGYTLTHKSGWTTDSDQCPHVVFLYLGIGGVLETYTRKVWLTAEGATEHFATREDIMKRLSEELDDCYAGASTRGSDAIDPAAEFLIVFDVSGDIRFAIASGVSDALFAFGPVPWILNAGWVAKDYDETIRDALVINDTSGICSYDSVNAEISGSISNTSVTETLWGVPMFGRRIHRYNTKPDPLPGRNGTHDWIKWANGNAVYAYQYRYTADTEASNNVLGSHESLSTFPWPYEDLTSSCAMKFGDSQSLVDWVSQNGYSYLELGDAYRLYGTAKIPLFAVFAADLQNTYINVSVDVADQWRFLLPAGKLQTTTYPAIYDPMWSKGPGNPPSPLRQGGMIWYCPEIWNEGDPWAVRCPHAVANLSNTYHPIAQIFRGILGLTSEASNIGPDIVIDHIPDVEYSIDWSMMSSLLWARSFPGAYYRLDFSDELPVSEMMYNTLLLFGITPTYKYYYGTKRYKISFEEIAPINGTLAASTGNTLGVSNISSRDEIISQVAAKKYNGVTFSIDYDGNDGKYRSELPIYKALAGASAPNAEPIKIQTPIVHLYNPGNLKNDNSPEMSYLKEQADTITGALLDTTSEIKLQTSIETFLTHTPGTYGEITHAYIRNPFSAKYDISDWPFRIIEQGVNFGTSETGCKTNIVISPSKKYGWGPTLRLSSNTTTKVNSNSVTIALVGTTDDFFGRSPLETRIDISDFDCLYYDESTGEYMDKNCSCSDYSVTVIRDNGDHTYTKYSSVTIGSVSATAKTATLTSSGLFGAWDKTKVHYIFFPLYSDALQPCQRKWCFAGNTDRVLIDNTSAETQAQRWCR